MRGIDNWLIVDWIGSAENHPSFLSEITTSLGIHLHWTEFRIEEKVEVRISGLNVKIDNKNIEYSRKGAIMVVGCDLLSVNGEQVDIYVFGEGAHIPSRWRNIIFFTAAGKKRLPASFADLILGWADERSEGRAERPMPISREGKLLFGDEHIRLAQDRVYFTLKGPPQETARILWIYANPYIDLLAGPYGLEILDSICREKGFVTRITNPFVEFLAPIKGLRKLINAFQPTMIGISFRNIDDALIVHSLDGDSERVDTYNLLPDIKRLVDSIRDFEGPIFIGGAAFGTAPEKFLDFFGLNYGIIGAAEAAMEQLCERWGDQQFKGKEFEQFHEIWSSLPGAVWREKEGFVRNNPERTSVLKQTPKIRRTWSYTYKNIRDYLPEPVRGAQGCPIACSYCVEAVNRRRMSWRSIQQVVDEMEFSYRRYGIRIFHLADSEANLPFERLISLSEELIRRKLNEEILWTAYLNARPFETEAIPLLAEAGLYRFKFAFDHFDDRMLKSYKKNFRERDLVKLLDGFEPFLGKVQLYAGILLGGPKEDEATIQYAIRRMKEHARRGFTFYYNVGVRIYPGTPFGLQDYANEAGSFYGPGKDDGGISTLVYCSPDSPRRLASRLEKIFAGTPRIFRMNREKTTDVEYEEYRRFLVAWNAWLDGRSNEAMQILEQVEGLHRLREGVLLQRLLRLRARVRNFYQLKEEEQK